MLKHKGLLIAVAAIAGAAWWESRASAKPAAPTTVVGWLQNTFGTVQQSLGGIGSWLKSIAPSAAGTAHENAHDDNAPSPDSSAGLCVEDTNGGVACAGDPGTIAGGDTGDQFQSGNNAINDWLEGWGVT